MKNISNKQNRNENKQQVSMTLARINEQILALNQERAGLAEPLKLHYSELRTQLSQTETQIRDLDPTWKPTPMKPKADTRIKEIIEENGEPMTADEILKKVGDLFTSWKVKNTLKKKSSGAKAIFAVNDGKYSVKSL
jgi:hypothetical protein